VSIQHLSARAYHRVHPAGKLGRTLVDLAGSEHIQTTHMAEAIQVSPTKDGVKHAQHADPSLP
jgi:predicted ATPase with chaperone activity